VRQGHGVHICDDRLNGESQVGTSVASSINFDM
jgi:hypothetical protein